MLDKRNANLVQKILFFKIDLYFCNCMYIRTRIYIRNEKEAENESCRIIIFSDIYARTIHLRTGFLSNG